MGKSASSLAGAAPRFRTGNVVPPADVRVTARRGAGKDFIPQEPLTSVAKVPFWFDAPNVESLAAERAKVDMSGRRESLVAEIAGMERDTASGVFRLANGAMVRTVDMGDDALAAHVKVASTIPVGVPTAKQTRRAERKAADAEIIGALAKVGIDISEVTPRIREGWRDFVAAKRAEAGL
jgi:hypothetical protein